jgi:ribonuclease P protein component
LAKISKDAAGEIAVEQIASVFTETSQAVSFSASGILVLKKRSDFVAASKALRQSANSMLVQARLRKDDDPCVRIGFTCSKKVGNAVARNRAKRRLRAVAQHILARSAQPGFDYVLIGRHQETAQRPFDLMCHDLEQALAKIHKSQSTTRSPK